MAREDSQILFREVDMKHAVVAFISSMVQVKVSFIGFNHNACWTFGKPEASCKILEVSAAIMTLGFRATIRI
jgi:hypothetical protein